MRWKNPPLAAADTADAGELDILFTGNATGCMIGLKFNAIVRMVADLRTLEVSYMLSDVPFCHRQILDKIPTPTETERPHTLLTHFHKSCQSRH